MSRLTEAAAQVARALAFLVPMYRERARITFAARVRGDLFSRLVLPSDRTDPYEIYRLMRARGPILGTRLGNYTTTSHAICREVLRSRDFGVTPNDGSADEVHSAELDLSLLTLNPPDHTRLRRLAAPAFTPRRMAGYVPLVDAAIDRLIEDCLRRRSFDLMATFASPLPITVMTHLLGLPDDPDRFRRLGATIASGLDGIGSLRQASTLAAADAELRGQFAALIAQRETDPGDDLVSALVAEQGGAISPAELSALCRLLLLAGFETTVNAIGNGMRWLLADREQWQLLVEDPTRADAAAEEVLRYEPPVQQTARVAHVARELGGVRIERNQWVVTILGAANRDPEAFSDPDRFDLRREPTADHLSFSGGIHYCLGAPLARMELARALAALATRLPDLRPAGPLEMRPGTTLRGPRRFPVTLATGPRLSAA